MKKTAENIVKIYPVVINLLLVIMGIEYLLGIRYLSTFLSPILGYSTAVIFLLLVLSIRFNLCFWSRILIANMGISNIMDVLSSFGIQMPLSVYILAVSAVVSILFTLILWLSAKKNQQC